jgi:hypothetical protein
MFGFLEFSLYKIMISINQSGFTVSFPVKLPFISFSYLSVLARTSSTMWSISHEKW